MMKKTGFSLIEMLVVLAIFSGILAVILGILSTHDRSWRIGENERIEQQEARRAISEISSLLKTSNPDWDIGGNHYPVSVTSGNRIDFYRPLFDAAGNIVTLNKITFKLNPDDTTQLLEKDGLSAPRVIANYVQSLSFGGGCAGCSAYNCNTVALDCPVVEASIQIRREAGIDLRSRVTLRNNSIMPPGTVTVEEPVGGEF